MSYILCQGQFTYCICIYSEDVFYKKISSNFELLLGTLPVIVRRTRYFTYEKTKTRIGSQGKITFKEENARGNQKTYQKKKSLKPPFLTYIWYNEGYLAQPYISKLL